MNTTTHYIFGMTISDLGVWVGSVATSLALIFAFVQLMVERRSRSSDQRRKQATTISAWLSRPYDFPVEVSVQNSSSEPVYQVIFTLVLIQGGGIRDGIEAPADYSYRTCLSVLPPGRLSVTVPSGGHGMMRRLSIETCFTDASGRHWVRKGSGRLEEISKSPVEYYGLRQPVGWQYPVHNAPTSSSRKGDPEQADKNDVE